MGFDNLKAAIDKQYGEGSMMKMSDDISAKIELLGTGVMEVDAALGGGIPFGRIVEIFGPESSGKTMLASTIVANAQKQHGLDCLYVDTEHALDFAFMRDVIGVNVGDLFVAQPSTAEEALGIIETAVKGTERSIIILDSVAALAPRAELEGDVGDAHVGLVARMMGQFFRMVKAEIANNDNILIMINQLRSTIGGFGFGPNDTTPGGRALKYYASQRIDIRRIGSITSGEDVIGQKVKVKVVKNKIAPPQKVANVQILYNKGFYVELSLVEVALKEGVLKKAGAWIKDAESGETLGQGPVKTAEWLEENQDYCVKLKQKLTARQ